MIDMLTRSNPKSSLTDSAVFVRKVDTFSMFSRFVVRSKILARLCIRCS